MAEFLVSSSVRINQSDKAWDAFVGGLQAGTIYHTKAWQKVIESAFAKQSYALEVTDHNNQLAGVLPLTHVKSRLLGNRLVSMPYANYGGALANTVELADQLRAAARELAARINCDYSELRETGESTGSKEPEVRRDKAIMRLSLPESIDVIGKQIGAKKRSQARRALKENAEVLRGGIELLPLFYDVFSRNMRDLGTPVYPMCFFESIFTHCESNVRLIAICVRGKPAAAGFLIRWKDTMEIPWASSIREFNSISVNMLLYWEALKFSIEVGCTVFDFGRSTIGGGTYRFKKQWGAEPLACMWRTWPRQDSATGDSQFRKYATGIWKRLPLPVANMVGPWISPNLPW